MFYLYRYINFYWYKKKSIILAKGSDKSWCKFLGGKNVEVCPTNNQNEWVTEIIMVKYLRYLVKNWANNEPWALILVCFKAHHTSEVIKVAAELNINLIFVSAAWYIFIRSSKIKNALVNQIRYFIRKGKIRNNY